MKKIIVTHWKSLLIFILLALGTGCYKPTTTINSLTPSAGTFGTEVTIKGGYLSSPIDVDFNGVKVPHSEILSSTGTEIKVLVPAGATSGKVHVITSNGTGESPYDFTVVSNKFTEQEPNNTFDQANQVNLNDHISGRLESTEPDWFVIRSGSPGVWGYTLEFSTETTNMPSYFRLRTVIETKPQYTSGARTTNDGNKTISWVTLPPSYDVYLMIDAVGSGTWTNDPDYTIHISRIPIKDKNEPNDEIKNATPIFLNSGIGSNGNSYLCNIFNSDYIGFKDHYRIPAPQNGQSIAVIVTNAGLEGQNNDIYLELIDENYGSVASNYGNSEAATLEYTVPDDTNAMGDWYVLISNPWHGDDVCGNGPAPMSCKKPYNIAVFLK